MIGWNSSINAQYPCVHQGSPSKKSWQLISICTFHNFDHNHKLFYMIRESFFFLGIQNCCRLQDYSFNINFSIISGLHTQFYRFGLETSRINMNG